MTLELFPYQETGRDFLSSKDRALLADTMGLGKSGQAIAACGTVNPSRVLVLCPAAVRFNWDREFPRFSSLDLPRRIILSGKDQPLDVGITICSYELTIQKKMHERLMEKEWDVLICDESHYLKSHTSKRTKAVYGAKCDGKKGIISISKRAWMLTGTPMPNDATELFPMLKAFGQYTGTHGQFIETYCKGYMSDYGFKITGLKNAGDLKKKLKSISLRRRKEEVLKDLPPISFHDWVLDPNACDKEYLKEMLDMEHGPEADEIRRLIQCCEDGTPVDYSEMAVSKLFRLTGMAKVKAAAKQLREELASGEMRKVVVFGINRDVVRSLRDELKMFGAKLVFGGTKPERKQNAIESFRTNSKCRVFVANIAAAGTGIDGLQDACNHVVFVQGSWTPSDNLQAAMRVHRIGQERPVMVRFMSLAGSLDEHVQNVVRRKTEMIDNILD